jgi:hypothetical protein
LGATAVGPAPACSTPAAAPAWFGTWRRRFQTVVRPRRGWLSAGTWVEGSSICEVRAWHSKAPKLAADQAAGVDDEVGLGFAGVGLGLVHRRSSPARARVAPCSRRFGLGAVGAAVLVRRASGRVWQRCRGDLRRVAQQVPLGDCVLPGPWWEQHLVQVGHRRVRVEHMPHALRPQPIQRRSTAAMLLLRTRCGWIEGLHDGNYSV